MQDKERPDQIPDRGRAEESFEVLFQRYERLLAARIRDRLPPSILRRVSVADVLQETHLAAYEARQRMPTEEEQLLRSWLLSIADHKALDQVRRHGRVAKRSVEREITRAGRPETAAMPHGAGSPSEVAMAGEAVAIARRVRAMLPPEHAEILRLAREEGVPLREIAARLDKSHEGLKKLYGRALRRFRELYESLDGGSM